MPGKGARGGADMRRAAAVLLLVAVAAVGLRAGGAFSAAGSPEILGLSSQAVYWTIAGAEVVLALAGIALLIARLIWARKSGTPLRRQRRSIWWLFLLPFFALGLAKVLQRLRQRSAGIASAAANHAGPRNGGAMHLHAGNPWPLLVFFVIMALAAAALTAYRRRPAAPPPPQLEADPDAEPLAAALAAGARALHSDPDPRAAIIGCYAAMERSLADAGLPPRMADTPAEVLSRATASGLVRPAAPATLTGLFRQARYSSHPMAEADRAAAIEALAQVRADLDSGTLAQADLGGGS
jgi:Domain of unknown function (DUF4129)